MPLFPIKKFSTNLLSIYGPVSDKELSERPEYIPRHFPAMHPEWCSDHVGGDTLLFEITICYASMDVNLCVVLQLEQSMF